MPASSFLLPAMMFLVAITVSACGGTEAKTERERQALAQKDAESLASEIFDLVDQAAGYQSSHGTRQPRSLRAMGVDSLTPTTARWIETRGGTAWITVAFRRLTGHGVSRCSGSAGILEQLALEGAIELDCTLVDGTREELIVSPSSP